MNGDKLLLDTNAFIYYLEGRSQIRELFDNATIVYYSVITEIELLSYHALSEKERLQIKTFLNYCQRVDLSESIIASTIELRLDYTLKIPDAIIAASCLELDVPLISADVSFDKIDKLSLISDILK